MDNVSIEKRRDIMSRVRSENTKPEAIVRKYLFSRGFRYRKNDRRYPGKPDIVLPKYRTVVFVNGCFWHQHKGCKASNLPENNRQYWADKLSKNIVRDKRQIYELENDGWKVIVIWECELSNKRKQEERLGLLAEEIKGMHTDN